MLDIIADIVAWFFELSIPGVDGPPSSRALLYGWGAIWMAWGTHRGTGYGEFQGQISFLYMLDWWQDCGVDKKLCTKTLGATWQ
jgi:hypothetical protein